MNKIAIGFDILRIIPSIIRLVEAFHGSGHGAEKKAAATDLLGGLLEGAGAAVAANNPAYSDSIGKVIDATVSTMNGSGELPHAEAPAAYAIVPPPWAGPATPLPTLPSSAVPPGGITPSSFVSLALGTRSSGTDGMKP